MNTGVSYLSEILKLIAKVKDSSQNNEVIKSLNNDDTRKTFFEMLAGSLRVYYLGLDSIFIANKINPPNFTYNESEVPHIEKFGWLLDEKYLVDVYLPILKMNLINNCWVCFESTLRDIDQELNIVHPKNNKPASVYDIYTHKKFNAETKFLRFFGDCRNAMHNNSVHTKENCEYILNGESLKLEKDKEIEFIDDQKILEMIESLSDVALNMWENLNYPTFIKDRYNSI